MNELKKIIPFLMRYGVPLPEHLHEYFVNHKEDFLSQADSVHWKVLCDIYGDYPIADLTAWLNNYEPQLKKHHGSTQLHGYHYDVFKRLNPMLLTLYGSDTMEQMNRYPDYPRMHIEHNICDERIHYELSNTGFYWEHPAIMGFNAWTAEQQKPYISAIMTGSVASETPPLNHITMNISVPNAYNAHIRFRCVEDVIDTLLNPSEDIKGMVIRGFNMTFWWNVILSTEDIFLKKLLVHIHAERPYFSNDYCDLRYLVGMPGSPAWDKPLESFVGLEKDNNMFKMLSNNNLSMYYTELLRLYQEGNVPSLALEEENLHF